MALDSTALYLVNLLSKTDPDEGCSFTKSEIIDEAGTKKKQDIHDKTFYVVYRISFNITIV
jgi:hypothetical protein